MQQIREDLLVRWWQVDDFQACELHQFATVDNHRAVVRCWSLHVHQMGSRDAER